MAGNVVAGPTLRALLVGCTAYATEENNRIAAGVRSDVESVQKFLDRVQRADWNTRVEVVRVDGTAPTGTRVLSEVRKLIDRVEPGDTAFVYFSGHGGVDRDSRTPYLLATDEKHVNRNQIADLLRQSSAKMRILMTDCCSSYISVGTEQPESTESSPSPSAQLPQSVHVLLFGHSGFTDITGASESQYAFSMDDGGYFTLAILKAALQGSATTWRAVFDGAREEVSSEPHRLPDGVYTQMPFAFSIAEPDPLSSSSADAGQNQISTNNQPDPPDSPPTSSGVVSTIELQPGATLEVVDTGESGLIIRSEPSDQRGSETRLDNVPNGSVVTFLEDGLVDSRGRHWYKIRGARVEGYACALYLRAIPSSVGTSTGQPRQGQRLKVVNTQNTGVRVRERPEASEDSRIIGDLLEGRDDITYLGDATDSTGAAWYRVRFYGGEGFILASKLAPAE